MRAFLLDYKVTKLLLDFAHDAMPYYEYCRRANITPFIDLNGKGGIKLPYKNDFTIGKDGVPICRAGRRMNHDGSEPSKHRIKFRCPLASGAGTITQDSERLYQDSIFAFYIFVYSDCFNKCAYLHL